MQIILGNDHKLVERLTPSLLESVESLCRLTYQLLGRLDLELLLRSEGCPVDQADYRDTSFYTSQEYLDTLLALESPIRAAEYSRLMKLSQANGTYLETMVLSGLGEGRMSGRFLYRAGLDFQSFHTNIDTPGTRVYFTYTEGSAYSGFSYLGKDGEIHDTVDADGELSVRIFDTTEEDPFWHAVPTPERDRLSFGFWVV